jgi:arylsulfatase A-like enzyme
MRDLVLLTIDAWRADFVDEYDGVPLTPALEAVARHTARFTRAYTTGPWTSPGLISIFTGQGAGRHGVDYEWSAPRPGGPALAETLRQAGYEVPNLCYLNRVGNYQHLGYDPAQAPDYPHGPDDDRVLPALRARAAALRSGEAAPPAFLWYHYKYVHLPYWAGAPFRARLQISEQDVPARLRDSVCTGFVVPRQQFQLDPADREWVRRLYAAGVLQMDAWLGRVLRAIFDDPVLAERTTVVVTADHGDELLDHGHVGHASTAHHATLFEEVLRVPLLIIDRRVRGPRVLTARVQVQDLFPTMLSLAGAAPPPLAEEAFDLAPVILGQDDRAPAQERPFYFRSARMGYLTPRAMEGQIIEAVSDGRWKLVRESYEGLREALYDLDADPGELRAIEPGDAGEVGGAWARLRRLLDEPPWGR